MYPSTIGYRSSMWPAALDTSDSPTSQRQLWQLIDQISVGTMTMLTYEYLITLDDEVELMWTKPASSPIKWLYNFMRYFGLAAAILDRSIQAFILSTPLGISITISRCYAFYVWRLVSMHALVIAVEIMLFLRVHALYRKVKIVVLIVSLFLSEFLVIGINWILILPKLQYKELCMTSMTFGFTLQYGIMAVSVHIIIFCLTLGKHMMATRSGWNNTSIISLMIRDGAVAFVLLLGLLIATVIYTAIPGGLAFMHPWLISLVPCVGCRLIINLQRLAIPEQQGPAGTLELTTRVSESRWRSSTLS